MDNVLGAYIPLNPIPEKAATNQSSSPFDLPKLPFFLPMGGCRRRCVYCHQGEITGLADVPSPEEVLDVVTSLQEPHEICFFGGSFTCLPSKARSAYLDTVFSAPQGSCVRFSTHPECISGRIMAEIASYPISMVELGISSLDDSVLQICNRGYSGRDALEAMNLILSRGYRLGVQLMAGLPGQTTASSLKDLREISMLSGRTADSPITLRIYPCLVLKNTPLADLLKNGVYSALSVKEAALWAGRMLFEAAQLDFAVQRIGLQETPSLSESILAGPHHPALGEMARSVALVLSLLAASSSGPWKIDSRKTSLLRGHGKFGLLYMSSQTGIPVALLEREIHFSGIKHSLQVDAALSSE